MLLHDPPVPVCPGLQTGSSARLGLNVSDCFGEIQTPYSAGFATDLSSDPRALQLKRAKGESEDGSSASQGEESSSSQEICRMEIQDQHGSTSGKLPKLSVETMCFSIFSSSF